MANTVNTAGTSAEAGAVSCVTSVLCVAVTGYAGFLDGGHDYAELWNGTTWSPMTLPSVPGAASTTLIGVSCVTTTFCVAVGQATGPLGSNPIIDRPLIEQWNGTAWTVVTTSVGEATELDSVSCLSVTFCEAVGVGAPGGAPVGSAIAAQWNGSTWSAQPIDPAAQAVWGLTMSCTTATFCMAVGLSYLTGDVGEVWQAYSWNGSTWTLGLIAGGANNFFSPPSISCAGLAFCAAVAGNSSRTDEAMIWNGSTWSEAQNLPALGFSTLYGISCFSPTSCTAVGDTGGPQSEVLTFDGQSWTLVVAPPTGATGSTRTFLYGVDCLTDWACVTAGSSEFPSGVDNIFQPLLAMAPIARSGYRFVASDGGVFTYGAGAPFLGSMGGTHLNAPIVGMAVMPGGDGYYLVASDGGVFTFGSAKFYGSAGNIHLNKPIVGMALTADGGGYWLVASDGGIFSYGDAQFCGSTGAITLDKPVVGMAVPVAGGYYLVASDGGVFSFPPAASGGPPFFGSTGNIALNKPVIGMTTTTGGYYLSGSDGGVFTFPPGGVPPFLGSTGNIALNAPIVGIAG